MTIVPEVLLLSNRFDYTTDRVSSVLHAHGVPFLRLNSDDAAECRLSLDPLLGELRGEVQGQEFVVQRRKLRGVLYRLPTFLRASVASAGPLDLMAREHWLSFFRSLSVLDPFRWVNCPTATYRAELKPVQLAAARAAGFDVPRTIATNSTRGPNPSFASSDNVAIKGIDTVLFSFEGGEGFGYTIRERWDQLKGADLSAFPAIVQPWLSEKLDLRVTVVGEQVFAATVRNGDSGIEGDWRAQEKASFSATDLPQEIADSCRRLVRELGLVFGAIDLAKVNDLYWFLEINPTGEWAWLERTAGFAIADALVAALCAEG